MDRPTLASTPPAEKNSADAGSCTDQKNRLAGRLKISVVSPVYRAEECLSELYQRLTAVLSALTNSYEIVLVEDCGPDLSWERIVRLAANDCRVRGLQLSRNFGQHRAISAGLEVSRGEIVIVMDCDLQDPPEAIPQLIEKAAEGYDVVYTQRLQRADSLLKKLASGVFTSLVNCLSPGFAVPGVGTFSLASRKVVAEYLKVADSYSPHLWILHWLGFRSVVVEVPHARRAVGSSSYTFRKLVSHALNAMAAHSTALLHLSTAFGALFWTAAGAQLLYVLYRLLVLSIHPEGWTAVMIAIWFVGGTVLFALATMGLYLSRMFEATRNRPLFIIGNRTDQG